MENLIIRNRLKYWRHQLELNQKEFAEFLNINPSTVSRYESKGKSRIEPDTPALYNIFIKLKLKFPNLHMEDLLELVEREDN